MDQPEKLIVRTRELKEKKAFGVALFRVIYSFPVQLFFVTIKKNHALLAYWLILIAFVTANIGQRWGLPSLFLDPEYMGEVGFLSFFIVGLSIGGFIMTFQISSYIINAHRFPFLATVSRPFSKYVINNSIIPVFFLILYINMLVVYQSVYELKSAAIVFELCMALLAGVIVICFLTLTYFFSTNHDIFKILGLAKNDGILAFEELPEEYKDELRSANTKAWRVDTYFFSLSKIRLTRGVEHYKEDVIAKVFKQNHLNSAVFELVVFTEFLVLGFFSDFKYFKIPAAASLVLLFSLVIMLISALRFWLRNWANTFFLLLFIVLNYVSQFDWLYPRNTAYGLNYEHKVPYNSAAIKKSRQLFQQADFDNTLQILNQWQRNYVSTYHKKPKLVLINVSGGGSRAASWTFRVMQACDSILKENFMPDTRLISGASGGMLGAAYFRELYMRNLDGAAYKLNQKRYYHNIAKDLLNPIGVSITLNDMFFRFKKVKDGDKTYVKDRAYAFEKQFNENTDHLLKSKLIDYQLAEQKARVPMFILSPIVVNDGRRIYISANPVSYLCNKEAGEKAFSYQAVEDGIDFYHFFGEENAENLSFTSALRMNATFPYILPDVSLPTVPVIEVMDAGVRDNFGLSTLIRFMYLYRTWIRNNTAGVVVLQIRDTPREPRISDKTRKTIMQNLSTPLEVAYVNFAKIQLYNLDENMQYASSWLEVPLHYACFELPNDKQQISLSWHLTGIEKEYIYDAINLPQNKQEMQKLKNWLQ